LKDRLLESPRAKELARMKPPAISLKEFRAQFGGPGVSDDDLLLRYFAGADAVAAMRAAGAPVDYATSSTPLLLLLEQLAKRKAPARVFIERDGLRLRMERKSPA
jgi:hypothetical protein